MSAIAVTLLVGCAGIWPLLLLIRRGRSGGRGSTDAEVHARSVGRFYDEHCEAFLQVYGETIQAFRTKDVTRLLNYQAGAMGLKPGMRVLDAGCGVCGPAIHFAKEFGVHVDAVTVSGKQASIALRKVAEAGLADRVMVRQGDYHRLQDLVDPGSCDVVYFLESFGHSPDKKLAIDSAWHALKPGGLLYIKDLFVKETMVRRDAETIRANVGRINDAYRYRVGDLTQVVGLLRRKGFILSALKTIDIPLEDFENLTISNEFQQLTGIHRIDDLKGYLFPVDFFELLLVKPSYDPARGSNRYFLQNLYYMQVMKRAEHEL
jgi:ubiquinone/menaquinone biosynthesis C-methylase UbiE